MAAISRREFVVSVLASAGLAGMPDVSRAEPGDAPRGPLGLPIGSQVWPTRSMLGDFPAYVKMMADIGVTRLELCSPIGYGSEFSSLADGRKVKKILSDHGIKSESSHFTMGELRHSQEKSIAWVKAIGIKQMI